VDLLEFIVLLGTIISSSASLGYWLAGKISSLETGVGRLEQDFSSLRQDLSSLREDVYSLRSAVGRLDEGVKTLKMGVLGFNELLLEVLREKSVITGVEYTSMPRALRAYIPTSASKYYTEEVRKRLIGILDKSPDDYTMDDVYELRRIADLMVKEYYESGEKREDLLDYAGQLYAASLMMKDLYVKPKLLKAGIKPPEERWHWRS
jgi:hypothetical protein